MKKVALFALLLPAAACSRPDQVSFAEVDRMLQSGDSKSAIAALEALRKEEGPRADIMLRLGSAHERQKEFSRAVAAYKEGAEADPRSRELRLALANLYMNLAQYESARDNFLAARACGADDATVSISLGTCLGRIEDLAGAEEEFRRAVELAWKAVEAMPEDWRSHDVLGQAYLAQGDWEAAKQAFIEALRLGHNPPIVEEHYFAAEQMRRAALAIKKPAGS